LSCVLGKARSLLKSGALDKLIKFFCFVTDKISWGTIS
jgi:hypothetical protein